MKLTDIEREPCGCVDCVRAGVSEMPQRRDPRTGAFLHGWNLARWYQAREAFRTAARAAVGPKGRHAKGFERLVHSQESEQ